MSSVAEAEQGLVVSLGRTAGSVPHVHRRLWRHIYPSRATMFLFKTVMQCMPSWLNLYAAPTSPSF